MSVVDLTEPSMVTGSLLGDWTVHERGRHGGSSGSSTDGSRSDPPSPPPPPPPSPANTLNQHTVCPSLPGQSAPGELPTSSVWDSKACEWARYDVPVPTCPTDHGTISTQWHASRVAAGEDCLDAIDLASSVLR